MKSITKLIAWLSLLVCCSATAAMDPVSALLISTLPANTTTNSNYLFAYRLTASDFMPGAIPIQTSISSTGLGFRVFDFCNGTQLAPGNSCFVIVQFSPISPETASFTFGYQYGNTVINLPALETTVVDSQPTQGVEIGNINLPSVTQITSPSTVYDFQATVTNTGDNDVLGFGSFNVSPANTAMVTVDATNSTCSVDANTPTTLAANSSCTLAGKFTPLIEGAIATVTANYSFNANTQMATQSTQTHIMQSSGSCNIVDGSAPLPLPASTYQFSDNVVKFEFTNHCDSGSVNLGTVAIQSSINTATKGDDTCSGANLPANQSCSILVSVIPDTTGTLTLSASLPVTGGTTAQAQSSATVMANNPSTHRVHFVNQCPYTVWYGIANGNGGIFTPDPNLVTHPAGAPPDAYELAPQQQGVPPEIKTLALSEYRNGALWPRTNCSLQSGQFVCETGQCDTLNNSATCVERGQPRDQAPNPVTKFEFTIVTQAGMDGVYDVSVINGFNVPAEIKGLGPTVAATSGVDQFTCRGAGALIQPADTQLGSCPWEFDPSFSSLNQRDFMWVEAGADDACTNDGDCGAGEFCGMAYDMAAGPNTAPASPINRRCGKFLGYWTLADYVGLSAPAQWGSTNLYAQFGLDTLMSTISVRDYGLFNGNPAIFENMLGCQITDNTSNSTCYGVSNPNLPNCCGCVNWDDMASPVPTSSSETCLNINADWTNTAVVPTSALDAIKWLKQACPTAYAYQFDDPSSSFGCLKDENNNNMLTDYQIVFCPGGITGNPG